MRRCMGTEAALRYGGLAKKLLHSERTLSVRARAKRARLILRRKWSLWRSLEVKSTTERRRS
jgi:hypothetical protein